MTFNLCNHLFVDGFGGMGDAVVCIHCGLDMYTEAIPIAYFIAKAQDRVIFNDHPEYKDYFHKAVKAREIRRNNEDKKTMKEITSLGTTEVTLDCPHCGHKEEGFIVDPRGGTFQCDSCRGTYKVHEDADIEWGL